MGSIPAGGTIFKKRVMRKLFVLLLLIFLNIGACFAESNTASVTFSITIPQYLNIIPLTNTTLVAHVQNGFVTNPLQVKYKVVSK